MRHVLSLRRAAIPCLRAAGVLALLTAPAFPLGSVTGIDPAHVQVEAGGSPRDVTLAGTGLEDCGLLFLRREGGSEVPSGLRAFLGPYGAGSVTSRRVTVAAAASVPPGRYHLIQVHPVLLESGPRRLPLDVEVVAKRLASLPPSSAAPDPARRPPVNLPTPALAPDLEVVQCTLNPTNPTSGQAVAARVVLHNRGSRAALFPAGSVIWEASVLGQDGLQPPTVVRWAIHAPEGGYALAAGATDTRAASAVVVLPAGGHSVQVRADPGGVTLDATPRNNRRLVPLQVRAAAPPK